MALCSSFNDFSCLFAANLWWWRWLFF